MVDLDKLEESALAAKKSAPGKWEVQTSNSWRRIGTFDRDGGVICPIKQNDGHPDLRAPRGVLDYVADAAPDAMIELITEVRRLRKLMVKDSAYAGCGALADAELLAAVVTARAEGRPVSEVNGCSCDFCTGVKRYEDNWCCRCAEVKMAPPKFWENADVCDKCEAEMRRLAEP